MVFKSSSRRLDVTSIVEQELLLGCPSLLVRVVWFCRRILSRVDISEQDDMVQQVFVEIDGEQKGPFTPKQIREMAHTGELSPDDLLSFDGVNWGVASGLKGLTFSEKPSKITEIAKGASQLGHSVISKIQGAAEVVGNKVTEIKQERAEAKEKKLIEKINDFGRYLNDDQDPKIIESTVPRILQFLTSGEDLLYIAVQKKPVANFSPDCIALTSKRVIFFTIKLLGQLSFNDYLWRDVADATVKEGLMGATFSLRSVKGARHSVDYIPKNQARMLYRFAQEMEEKAHEERRTRMMEESRAAAGGVIVQHAFMPPDANRQPAPAIPAEDPLETLKKLKAMLDADLISQAEFDKKKAEILLRM